MIRIERNKNISSLTTFGVGGGVEYFCLVKNSKEFYEAIALADKKCLKWRLFSGGSNLVLPDKRISGLVIRMYGGQIKKDKTKLIIDAGVLLSRVVAAAIKAGFQGIEQLSGIPGTVGGAIVGNAGAYGCSISDLVSRVLVWDGCGERWISVKECGFNYRESIFKNNGWIVLRVELIFVSGDKNKINERSKEIIAERLKKYPKGLMCPGSYFKNILVAELSGEALKKIDRTKIIGGKVPVGYLLEVVGARGMRRGDVCVATYHGNLILNKNNGTTHDAKSLARALKSKVFKKFGILIEEEVRYW